MPNTFAYLVLFSWPLMATVLFAAQPPARAVSLAVIVGYLLLPQRAGIDLPMIPMIDRVMVINLTAALVMQLALNRERQIAGTALPLVTNFKRWVFLGLIALTLATPFLTVLTNGEPVIAGATYIPGIRLYDAVSLLVRAGITIVPFILGMRALGTPAAQTELLRVLVLAACIYALLALFEIRMSPQLNRWVYGFFPHAWIQHIRGGAFRPVVFLNHGLWLGIFLSMATLGCCALWRQTLRDRVLAAPWLAVTVWLGATLILSRNLGATALTILFAPVILFTPIRIQVLAAAVVAGIVLVFPMLRGAGLIPVDAVHDLALGISEDRARSLKFRLDNEDALLAHANEKPLAGWGSWGRNRIYDPQTGRDLSVTDGLWVITIGSFGWLGYIGQFGMLAVPVILLAWRRGSALSPATAGLSIAMAVALVDLIPNATLTPVTWIVAGALAGQAVLRDTPHADTATTTVTADSLPCMSEAANGPLSPIGASVVPLTPPPEGSHRHRRMPRR